MTPIFWIIVSFILAEFILSRYLDHLNSKSWSAELPEELAGLYDAEKSATAQRYSRERMKLAHISGYIGLAGMMLMLFLKGFAWLNAFALSITDNMVLQSLIFFAIIGVAGEIISLPFSWYSTFRIEEKYGFNKMTLRTFITDRLKGYLLTVLLGGGIAAAVIWIYYSTGSGFWWIAWICVSAVTLFISAFYTSLIVPLFNKLKPLGDGPLREKIESFAQTVSFPLKNIMIMDGSKRSTKANAYFSGIGGRKSIVLFDTLLEEQSEDELLAILAHEVGHYKKKHVMKGMVISILNTGLLFYLVGLFAGNPAFAKALSVDLPNFHIGILVFGMLYSPVSMITGIAMNIFSRKNEYEADDFAKKYVGGEHLVSALKKLSVHHLSNLKPHPAYVFFHYTHPPLLSRMRNLQN